MVPSTATNLARRLNRHPGGPVLLSLLLLTLILCVTILLPPATFGSHAGNDSPSRFAHFLQASDVKVTASRVLVSQCEPPPKRVITSLDQNGTEIPFATIPDADPKSVGCFSAPRMAISPGLGGFPKGNVYVSYGPRIWVIPPEGCPGGGPSCVQEFPTSPSIDVQVFGDETSFGLTFDEHGSFQYNLIAVGNAGAWTIDSSGSTRKFSQADWGGVDYHTFTPAVAPDSFEPYGGYLLVPLYGNPRVAFVSPSGGLSYTFFPQPGNEIGPAINGVSFVPPQLCELGQSGGTFFQGRAGGLAHRQEVRKFRAGDFAGREGNALLPNAGAGGETGYPGMILLASQGTDEPERSPFHSDSPESTFYTGSDFADCPDPWSATVSDERVDEGDPGQEARANFRVSLASPPTTPIKMHYETRPGSAEEGSDYLHTSGELSFGGGVAGLNGAVPGVDLPSETSAEIEVAIVGDLVTERNERFFVEITDPSRPEVLQAQGIATIVDDDEPAPYVPSPPLAPEPPPEPAGDEPPPTVEVEGSAPPPATHLSPAAPAAVGPQLPPPAPPGTAPAPSAGPAPGSAPGPGVVAGQSVSSAVNPLSAPVAVAPAPVPQVIPGVAGIREEKVQAAPESDYAMTAYERDRRHLGIELALFGAAIFLIATAACVATFYKSNSDAIPQQSPCFPA